MARAWSFFTHRKAIYAIEHGFPRWRQIAYELSASFAYPWDDTSEKLRTMIRAMMGDTTYQGMKRFVRSRLRA